MADITPTGISRILKWLLTTEEVERPVQLYLALRKGSTELTTPGYTRQPIFFSFPAGYYDQVRNTNTVDFTAGSTAFEQVNSVALYESATGGASLWGKPIGSRVVKAYETLRAEPNSIWIRLY